MPIREPIIAILDDEMPIRKALGRLLDSYGFHSVLFADGASLLAAAENCGDFDCILLDLHMPEMNGFDVLNALQRNSPPVPVIVITAQDQPGTAERVHELGAFAYLLKPVDKTPLLDAINLCLRKSCEEFVTAD